MAKTIYLHLGRGGKFQGLILSNVKLPQKLRQRDKLLELMRARLSGRILHSIEVDAKDRAYALCYLQGKERNYFMLFYKGNKTFVANRYVDLEENKIKTYKSWSNLYEDDDESFTFDVFNEVGRRDLEEKEKIANITDYIELESNECIKIDHKKVKFYLKKIKAIEGDLEKIMVGQRIKEIVQDLEYIKNLPLHSVIYEQKIKFLDNNEYKRRDILFTKLKNLRNAEKILEKRLIETKKDLYDVKEFEFKRPQVFSPVWYKKEATLKKVEEREKQNKEYEIINWNLYTLGIGKTAKGNENLRKEFSVKEDYWFHLENGSSPHLIVKYPCELSQELFNKIASLLNPKGSEADLIYTQVKNLKAKKGTQGGITYKNIKKIRAYVTLTL